ncbi:hypothetical protein Patl1_06614 [Pistacia atlantica]|uniref:Uncharacterized protein n=1 Tax=Pistacia atlantica TaxID=434234 RepID=A0ACC1BR57_9ROSI|nr:hypothetical protein Patl1_06614 [Pistacia atlantica]
MGSYKKEKKDYSDQQINGNNGGDTTYRYKMFVFKRKFKIPEPEPPLDVKRAFLKYSYDCLHMDPDGLHRFFVEHQGDVDLTISQAQDIIKSLIRSRDNVTRYTLHGLTLDDFFYFLLFDDEFNGPIKLQVHNDMTAPLSNYFIYTGHNSYLTGNQLSSDCSVVPIVKALVRGVRVIELDLWPNSNKDDINVLHGRTLTAPVSLIKCLKSIKDYAFSTSPYPVIITLEDHLPPDLQAKVAEMLNQVFGEMLYYPQSESLTEFPSPESLKYRIIISTKPPKEYLEKENGVVTMNRLNNLKGSFKERASQENGVVTMTRLNNIKGLCNEEALLELELGDDSDPDDFEVSESCPNKDSQLAVAPEYKSLITIHAGKPKGHLKDALKTAIQVKRLSLSEQELERAAVSHGTDVVRFTQKNILRVYPKGTRVNSSNYEPLVGWIHGAQMIAFNMQGYGKSLWKMHGMFRANGGCGYVKKPEFLMQEGPCEEVFDPKRPLPVRKRLKVKLYMGDGWRLDFSQTHFDKYSPPDFYTKVCIVGVPADKAKRKTKIIEDNWCPVWNEEFTFHLTVPELALLRIEVREYDLSEKDDFGGQTCLPVVELKPGIRSVPLHDKKGEKLKSVRLLMGFEFV